MTAIPFFNDYHRGAHPVVLERLVQANGVSSPGYGTDDACARARSLIQALCKREDADVHFLVGGTQANFTVIAAALRPHQGVLCAETGHIATHESGAVEATGHKVLPLTHQQGKITADQVEAAFTAHARDENCEHAVQPKLVYLSHPTEYGTLYTRAELIAIAEACHAHGGYLFVDGARLGYGLTAEGTDVDIPLLAQWCDAFTIGGTKQGLLFGEAVVLNYPLLKIDFRYIMKQRGGMLAKGWLLGLQYEALLETGIYFTAARHANDMAGLLRRAFHEKGIEMAVDSPTNQLFPIIPKAWVKETADRFALAFWGDVDSARCVMRVCTSWATSREDVEALAYALPSMQHDHILS